MSALSTLAAQALRELAEPRTLEELLLSAALRTLADGRVHDPPRDRMRAYTRADQLWAGLAPHADHHGERVARLVDATDLAIARADDDWLDELRGAWAEVGDGAQEWAVGRIDLAQGRPAWDAEAIEWLLEDGIIAAGDARDVGWIALAEGDFERARASLDELVARHRKLRAAWEAGPELALKQLWYWPGIALQLPERALAAALQRWA